MTNFALRYNESKARSDLVKLLKKRELGYSYAEINRKLKKYSEVTVLLAISDLVGAGVINNNVLMETYKSPRGMKTEYGVNLKPKYFSKLNSKNANLIVV